MTEITRVPLQPIAKGALGKLWLGLALAVGAAGAVAYAAMPPLVSVKTVQAGTGASPTLEDVAFVSLEGKLKDGTVIQPKAQGPVALSTRPNTSASTLPPHKVVPTTWPRNCSRSAQAAAKLAAPAPSATLWVSV